MINHFRSLLLNETASTLVAPNTAHSLHIDPSFNKLTLPADVALVYGLLFPNSNVESKLYLVDAYLALLKATGLDQAALELDSRITYTLEDSSSLFNTKRFSVGIPSASYAAAKWLRVANFNLNLLPLDYDVNITLTIAQLTNTTNVQVTRGATIWRASTALVFTDDVSAPISVYNPADVNNKAFDFSLKYTGGATTFVNSSAKSWTVRLSLPFNLIWSDRAINLQKNINTVTQVINSYPGFPSSTSYDNMWNQHFNSNYRLAGLVVALMYRMNKLRG